MSVLTHVIAFFVGCVVGMTMLAILMASSGSPGERAQGRVGRKEQADFPTGASLVQPAPTGGPTRTDVSSLHLT